MTDEIEEIRAVASELDLLGEDDWASIVKNAADRIEQLEATLARVEGVQRYTLVGSAYGAVMQPHDKGEHLRFKDVEAALKDTNEQEEV